MCHKRRTLLFLLFGLLVSIGAEAYSVKGVLDLRRETFQSQVPLDGEWEFYWNQLKSPRDIFEGERYVEFPQVWKRQVIDGDTLYPQGYATYRLKVILPNSPSNYELYVEDMYSAYALYVDGKLVASNGQVGTSLSESTPEWKPIVVSLDGKSGIVELVLNISNWRHSKGGANMPIMMGREGQVTAAFQVFTYSQVALFILCFLVSFFFLYRFVFVSHDWSSFYFAIFLMVYSYRLIGADTYLLHQWVAYYPWTVAVRIEYLSLFISTFVFALFVFHLYRKKVGKNFIIPLLSACFLFSMLTLFTGHGFFTRLLLPFFAVLIFYIIYGFYLFTVAAINDEIGSLYGVVSVAVVFTSFMYQMFCYVGWLEFEYRVTLVAHLLFLGFQSVQLYKQSQYSLKTN